MPAKDGRFYTFTINPRQVKREVKKVEWCKRGQGMACKVWGNRKDDYKLIERVRGEIDGCR